MMYLIIKYSKSLFEKIDKGRKTSDKILIIEIMFLSKRSTAGVNNQMQ